MMYDKGKHILNM